MLDIVFSKSISWIITNIIPTKEAITGLEISATVYAMKTDCMALDSIFTEHKTPISSTKSMTGHECWMAGASEIVYSVLMMKNDFIAPNINFETPDEYSQNLNIISSTQSKKLDVILSNSFGFGGTNSTLIIKKI